VSGSQISPHSSLGTSARTPSTALANHTRGEFTIASDHVLSLFSHLGKHEIFTPIKEYPPMTARELACSRLDDGLGWAI
jgi:hypothetical protein